MRPRLPLLVTGLLLVCAAPAAPAAPAGAAARDQDPTARLLDVLLHQTISVSFLETRAEEAFAWLGRVAGIRIEGRYLDDQHLDGIDPDRAITLEASDEPVLTVLQMMLEASELSDSTTWQLRRGYVEVGTKGRLSVPSAQDRRMYPVRDLLYAPVSFDNAPDLNVAAALNQGGGNAGGGGGSGGGSGGGFGRGAEGGGGSLFTDPTEPPARIDDATLARELIDIIRTTVEGEEDAATWRHFGGTRASITYIRGVFIVRAPDYIHRQLAGYPHLPTTR